MEIKKSKNANLEKRRGTHLLIGLILSLAFVWMSFEYKSYDRIESQRMNQMYSTDDEDVIIQTKAPEKLEPPKVIPIAPPVIVDNTVDVPDIDISVEIDEGDEIDDPIFSDEGDDEVDEPQIFVFVEDPPEFPGGEEALIRFLSKINYPAMAIESGTQGTVNITFVVEKDGSVTNVSLMRGIGNGCDEESLRIVKSMPKWSPGKQRERPVRVQIIVPIKFVLRN